MSFQYNFFQLNRFIWFLVFCAILILFVGRLIFLANISDIDLLLERKIDFLRALMIGVRFDFKVATIAFAPLFLAGLLSAAFPVVFGLLRKIILGYAIVVIFLITGFSIGNYYYYLSYGNYIDVFIFGLFDDDTQAVLANAWADFPIFRSFIASVCVTMLAAFGIQKILKSSKKWRWNLKSQTVMTFIVVLTIVSYFFLARGSIGTFPLKRYHANVSDYDALNKVTPNALMALNWAYGDYKKQATFKPVAKTDLNQQMLKVLGQPTPEYTTPKNKYLTENPPHVVMVLMEGMGTNVLVEDDPVSNDLLGELRVHFEQDFVFKRFLAGTSATIDSLMMMLFHSSVPTISHSNAQKVVLPGSAVLPYKQAGYESTFITAGNAMWRNLSNYLPLQGFDNVIDENLIKREFPQAEDYADTWGVPDEYAFKYAEKLLQESTVPQLIYILTVTNHSPFRPPENYQPKPVKVTNRLTNKLGSLSGQSKALLQTYQYANDSLGRFIKEIKTSSKIETTMIAASGDHRVRYLDINNTEEFGLTFAVPFYLYVPKSILEHTPYRFNEQRLGSHRDIFPTLYHYSLSDAHYTSLGGENLLSSDPVANFGYNTARVITTLGASGTGKGDVVYPWKDDGIYNSPKPMPNPTPNKASEYKKLQDMYLNSRVMGTY